jgi:transposase
MQSGVPTKQADQSLDGGEMTDKPIVGVDVAKDWLDLCTGETRIERIANREAAIAAWFDRVRPALVAFEPTGGYERRLVAALRQRAIVFVRVHPNRVIAFRESRGVKAKTDPIDARLIRAFTDDQLSRGALRPSLLGDERLRELAARRRQLTATLHAERCRLAVARTETVRASLEQVITVLRASLDAVEADIAVAVAATLIADLPELGLLSGKQIAALVGLAPRTRRSGKGRYQEPIGYGRPAVRQALFNAARAAIRHPSPFRDFYRRLVHDNHRPGKVALTAVMRKLLVTANAVARDRQPWHGRQPEPRAGGTECRPHGEPIAHQAGRVKAAAAHSAVARSASLDAA